MPTRVLKDSITFADIQQRIPGLLRDRERGTLQACQRIREFHPQFADASDEEIARAPFTQADAELTLAHEYGFASWERLKAFAELPERPDVFQPAHLRIEDPSFRQAVDLLDAGDAPGLRELLQRNPALATQRLHLEGMNYFHDPTLLEFIAENPTRNGRLPANAPELAQIVIDAGAKNDRRTLDDTLALIASSAVARESGMQPQLIRVLSAAGADPNDALPAPLIYGSSMRSKSCFATVRNSIYRLLRQLAACTKRPAYSRTRPSSNDSERCRWRRSSDEPISCTYSSRPASIRIDSRRRECIRTARRCIKSP